MIIAETPTQKDKENIKKNLKDSGLQHDEIELSGKDRLLRIVKEENSKNIIAFYSLKKQRKYNIYPEYIVLEYFWIDPAFRNKGYVYKIGKLVLTDIYIFNPDCSKFIIDSKKEYCDLIEGILGHAPYAYSNDKRSVYFEHDIVSIAELLETKK